MPSAIDSGRPWRDQNVVALYAAKRQLFPFETSLFGRHIEPGSRVLDLGVGAGRTTEFLASRARRYVGLDFSLPMVESCRQAFPGLDFRHGDAQDLSAFEDGAFDAVVFSYNGIDYLHPDVARHRCLREVHRVLSTRGVFVFSTHNIAHCLPDVSLSRPRALYWALRDRATWARLRSGLPRLFTRSAYVLDPVLVGASGQALLTHCATVGAVIDETRQVGFEVVETEVAGWTRSLKKSWLYYCFRKSEAPSSAGATTA